MSQPPVYYPLPRNNNNTAVAFVVVLVVLLLLFFVMYGGNLSSATLTNTSAQQLNTALLTLNGTFQADNYLTVLVNDQVKYAKPSVGWTDKHNVSIPNVNPGDKVTFSVENSGGAGGFTGSFSWNGKHFTVSDSLFPGKVVVDPSPWAAHQSPSPWLWSSDNCDTCTVPFNWTAA